MYTTQLLHSTVEACWNNSDSYYIWLKLCAESLDKSFQEVLEAVLLGGWSIPPTAHGWLHCGSPTRVSTTFILYVGKLLFALTCISNNVLVWYFDFWGKWENFVRASSSHASGSDHQNLSPTWKNYLGTVMRAVRA